MFEHEACIRRERVIKETVWVLLYLATDRLQMLRIELGTFRLGIEHPLHSLHFSSIEVLVGWMGMAVWVGVVCRWG